jgi:hypothetical protein
MANYYNISTKWININFNDFKYNFGLELIQPLSPIFAANNAGFK